MAKKRRRRGAHPCNALKHDHVKWVISEHADWARWAWLRKLRQDITRDMLKDLAVGALRSAALRFIAATVGGGVVVHYLEKLFS